MLKALYFVPLFLLTIYIIVRSLKDDHIEKDFEKEEKQMLIRMAVHMLHKGSDYLDPRSITGKFHQYDFSDEDDPIAVFDVVTDIGIYPFETKDGKIIRHRSIRK